MAEDMSEEQAQALMRDFIDQKSNKHAFLTKVAGSDDTIKTGNLAIEELGNPTLELRAIKELELFSKNVYGDETWSEFFKELAEIQTSTSLSKDAILIKLASIDKKEMADMTPIKKENKGWFK
jgi:hypothetical protein